MNETDFIDNARLMAIGLLRLCESKGFRDDEVTNLIGMALLEALAQRLGGVVPAVERLRLLADIAEAQALGGKFEVRN